ncbi:Spy0128 family protein [Gordonibacter urolithinfaciens]|uniref:Spy0128 family protein n=1 Tax=Gordonibacter urolithinfaciens TaxID=1335613 RepID=UPI003A941D4E
MADQSTLDTWKGHAQNSTENVGRIWTDKTVQTDDITLSGSTSGSIKVDKADGADFLVGLSALSSTSNLTSTSSKPLDIVLVLDTSGSMDDSLSEISYAEDYNPESNFWDSIGDLFGSESGYYIQENGEWVKVKWNALTSQWYTGNLLSPEYKTPKTSPDDPNGVQFYLRIDEKMLALKNSVNHFIDKAAEENAGIEDPANRHRISIVTYATGSETRAGLTDVYGSGVTQLHDIVDGLSANGATYADEGMKSAQTTLNSARENAQKVVLFFTDGEPNHQNGFDNTVAASTVNTSKELKDAGAIVFSVGVFDGADPSDTTQEDFNKYMNAVSSNYPTASASGNNRAFNVTWGDRAEGAECYMAAKSSAELDRIFEEIFEEIKMPGSSPTEVEEGFGGANGGYITFTDTLGDYMEVKGDVMTVVFANRTFNGVRQDDGSFAFSGSVEGNPVYPDANLSNLAVKVTPGVNGKGDTVEVKIPAQLIPLRNYTVKTENGSTTFETDEAYPIRVFYSVGLQDGVQDKVNNPDNAMSAYIAANKTEDGTVAFYSNDWNRDAKTAGTTATFTPASTNKFYYFTQDTPLYTDEGCTKRATRNDIEGRQTETVYYKNEFYTQDGTVGTAQTEAIAIPVSVFQSQHANNWSADSDGNAFMKAGAPRLNRTNDFIAEKDSNITGTAGRFISPSWNDDQSGIVVSLGNNGKVSVEQGVTLEVKKNITAAEGFDASNYTDTDFTFDMVFENVPDGAYKAEVKQNGAVVSDPGFAVVVSGGKAAHAIKPNQVLYIYGLPAGGAYNVTERPVAGFTQVAGQTTGTAGTFAAGRIATAQFVNEYKAAETQLADGTLKVRKGFTGRDWRDGDEFAFTIGTTNNAPLPNPATVTVNKNTTDHTTAFGAITYTKPGEYRYSITEQRGNLVGVNYSAAQWRVIVDVVDNGNGTMTATPKVEKLTGDDGIGLSEPEIADSNTAVFNNIYTIDSDAVLNLEGTKGYTDNSVAEGGQGGNPIDRNKFTFQLKANGGYVTDGGSDQNLTISAADVPMPLGAEGTTMQQGNVADAFNFPDITFGPACVGNTYVYEVAEVTGTEENMSYDKTVYTVKVEVTEETEGEGDDAHAHITATPTYSTAEGDADAIAFANSYTPDSATLSGDTAVAGTKTMTGRDMLEGEEFTFRLTPTGNTVAAIDNGTVGGITTDGLTSTAAKGGEDGVAVGFNFSDIAFTKVGTYTFAMSENVPAEADKAGGVNYDTHDCTVTVNVTLNKETGALEAAVDYGTNVDAAGNAFTNVYTASMSYGNAGGLAVAKTTQGRPMFAGEFEFTIEGVASDTVSAVDANAKLLDKDKRFTNGDSAEGAEWSAAKLSDLTFTQSDAGKTYSYIVDEVLPAQQKPSLTYDQNTYRVDIEVVDDLDGTMHTVTKVHRTANAEGELGTPELVGTYNSDEGQAAKVSFTNVYEPTPAVLEGGTALSVTKKVEGADTDARFDFTLRLTSNNAANVEGFDENGEMTASTSGTLADGSSTPISFGTLTFVEAGEYTFEVTENQGDQGVNGWTYDESTYTITVTVSPRNAQDEYDGALHVNAVSGNNPTFTNSYKAEPVIVGGDDATQHLSVEKTVEGKGTEADFNFTLSKVNPDDAKWNNVEAAEGADKASVTEDFNAGDKKTENFGMFTFKAEGTYQFQVVEDEAQGDVPAGWTYDAASKTIAVEVTDNGEGQLEATISGAAAFTNSYSITPATVVGAERLKGTKTLEGRDSLVDEAFDFTMTPNEATAQVIENGDIGLAENADKASVGNLSNGVAKGFNFGDVTINKAGTYTFTVAEVLPEGVNTANPTKNGVTYDTTEHTVTIKAEDAGNGTFNVTVEGADALNFTNIYAATPATWGYTQGQLLGGTKSIDDASDGFEMVDNQFTFYMRAQEPDNPMPEGLEVSYDDQNRGMASVKNQNTAGAPNETATYDFGYIVFDGNDMLDAVKGDDGLLTKTFNYNIWEGDTAGIGGIQKDNDTYTVTFTVKENQATGEMWIESATAVMIVGGTGDNKEKANVGELDFVNIYNPEKAVGYQNIFKTLVGRDFQDGDKFVFDITMTAVDEADQPMAQEDLPTVTAGSMGGSETSSISDLTYVEGGFNYTSTIEPLNTQTGNTYRTNTGEITYEHVGTYTWKVKESAEPKIANVVNSTAEYTLVVKVTSNGNELVRTVESITPAIEEGSNTLPFYNVYTPGELTLTGEKALAVQKTLNGRNWTEGDAFNFTLIARTPDAPMPAGTEGGVANVEVRSATATAGEAVAAAFGDITYTKDDLGTVEGKPAMSKTFIYEIDETNTDGYGLTMDSHVATVRVTVTDDGKGNLSADVSYDNTGATTEADKAAEGAAAFTNTYASAPVTDGAGTPVGVTKVLEGRDVPLQAGEFEFAMSVEAAEGSPADGFTMPENATAANAADGTVSFDRIEFTKAGTYHVTVRENVPAEGERAPFMDYDEHEHSYDVVVTDNGVGQLVAEVENEQGGKTFTNTYKADEPSKTVGAADDPATSIGGKLVGVGDELTYTINWVNDALDPKTGESVAAGVTITDTLPVGTEFVSATENGTHESGIVTWDLGKQAAGATGSVQVTVRVTDEAAQYDKVENTAEIVIGQNAPQTVTDPGVRVPGKTVGGVADDTLQVGDVLTYAIQYANDQDVPATVTVTDVVPEGLTVDAASISDSGVYDEASRTITWTFENMAPETDGEVTFSAVVNEDAVSNAISNQATVKIGEHEVSTNTTTTPVVKAAQVSIEKEVVLTEGQGTAIDVEKAFEFTVNLADKNGNALGGAYSVSGLGEGVTIANGGTLTLKHGQKAAIENLPEGAKVTATETPADGYTPNQQTQTANADGTEGAAMNLKFVNTYDAEAATGVPADFQLAKVFEGREWTDDYAFEFTLTPVGDAPMPTDAEGNAVDTVVVNAPTEDDGKTAKFDFGAIEYAAAGTYEYEVNEVAGGNAGIAYATNTAKVKVTVTDLGAGKLVASATVADGTFVNTYDTGEVDFDTVAGGGLEIVKNLTGHAIKAGQFDFKMEGQDQASIDKLGGNREYTTGDAELDGNVATDVVPVSTGLVFEKADAGKTYTYKVSEIDDGAKGYTYDDTVYDLRFAVSDGGDGALTVDVYVNGELAATHTGEAASRAASEPVQLAFDNAYEADSATVGGEGEAQIVASKELIGRPMADGEFSFVVTDKNGAEVARGTNAADGTVAFDPIVYTTEKLNSDAASGAATRTEGADGVAVYAYQYIVAEDEASLDGGVAAVEKSFSFAVEVTDDGEGALAAKVSQPEMAFVNAYGASESAAISIKGAKALDAADGLTPPDIAGKFSFTMKGADGAPMPEGSSGDAKTVANDAFGNVDFGEIVYTMENVFGSEAAASEEPTVDEATGEAAEVVPMAAQRTKTFAYEITESGSVAGVVNDAEVKTIEVTVTDNGDGTLDVAKSTAGEATDFTFVNTYSVRPTDPVSPTDPSVEGAVKVTKQLTGRELVEGEFAFELRDERGTLVSEGVNDAEGNVSLGGIAFMAPGTYKFELSEVVPEGDLEGVTYDGTIHPLTATVTDNGDGTMSVAWSASSEEIVFRNSYVAAPASVTLGAAKVLEGAELADGQFAFQMLDRDGEVFREARNDEGGAVTFPTIEFTQAGTYTYTIVEVDDGQEGVAYDDARHEVVVTVTDDGEGHLTASVEGAEDMAFCNAYAAPVGPGPKPLPPAGDDGGALVRTGDAAPAAAIAGAALAAAALGVAALAAARLRRARRFGGGRDALE